VAATYEISGYAQAGRQARHTDLLAIRDFPRIGAEGARQVEPPDAEWNATVRTAWPRIISTRARTIGGRKEITTQTAFASDERLASATRTPAIYLARTGID